MKLALLSTIEKFARNDLPKNWEAMRNVFDTIYTAHTTPSGEQHLAVFSPCDTQYGKTAPQKIAAFRQLCNDVNREGKLPILVVIETRPAIVSGKDCLYICITTKDETLALCFELSKNGTVGPLYREIRAQAVTNFTDLCQL